MQGGVHESEVSKEKNGGDNMVLFSKREWVSIGRP